MNITIHVHSAPPAKAPDRFSSRAMQHPEETERRTDNAFDSLPGVSNPFGIARGRGVSPLANEPATGPLY